MSKCRPACSPGREAVAQALLKLKGHLPPSLQSAGVSPDVVSIAGVKLYGRGVAGVSPSMCRPSATSTSLHTVSATQCMRGAAAKFGAWSSANKNFCVSAPILVVRLRVRMYG